MLYIALATYVSKLWIQCIVLYRNGKGKEIISRYDTTMATDKMWYSDANGREMKLRKYGHCTKTLELIHCSEPDKQ